MSDMDESDYVEIRRLYGNYAPLFFLTDKPIGCVPFLTVSPCCDG